MAAFLFSVVSVGFAQVWVYHTRSIEKTRHFLVASHLAESLIERKMALGYSGTELGVEEDFTIMNTRQRGKDIEVRYDWTVTIEEIGGAEDKKRSVVVLVNWKDSTNDQGEIRLETIVASAL